MINISKKRPEDQITNQKQKSQGITDEIKFYKAKDAYGFLSNFYFSKFIDIDGKPWPTAEHYFQAMKH